MTAGRALALSALVVVAILSIGDVFLVPMTALRGSVIDVVAMFALSLRGHMALLAPLLMIQAVCVLAAMAGGRVPRLAKWIATFANVAGLVCALQSHLVLISYERFRGHLPFIAAWLALGAYLAVAYRMMYASADRRSRFGLAALGIAGALLATWANVTMYPGAYPSLHRSLTTVIYLLAHAALTLGVMTRQARPRGALRTWAPAAVTTLFLITMLAAGFASARALTLYRNFTVLGRAAVIDARESIDECVSPPAKLEDREASEVFARYSRMPPLPPTFRLADYNVMLVTIESLRYDETSLSGRAGATPNLARMVEHGAIAFHDAMAPSSGTLQSIGSLLAQTYPTHAPLVLQLPRWCGELQSDANTVPEIFRASGYTTFGALHALFPAALRGGEQGLDLLWIQRDFKKTLTSDEELADWTIEALDRAKAAGKRFFGWVFFISPHDPYFGRRSPDSSERDRYRQEIEHADAQLGRIYDHLRAVGLLDTTILIVMGDHGEEFREHGRTTHSFALHEESVHVPLVVLLPQIKGSAVTGVTSTLYVFPWLLSAGDERMTTTAKRTITDDLAPMMKAVDGAVVAELVGVDSRSVALIWDDRKLMHGAFSNYVQMYDRRVDRQEHQDLATLDFPYKPELEALGRYHALRACRQRATQIRELFKYPVNHTKRDDVRLR